MKHDIEKFILEKINNELSALTKNRNESLTMIVWGCFSLCLFFVHKSVDIFNATKSTDLVICTACIALGLVGYVINKINSNFLILVASLSFSIFWTVVFLKFLTDSSHYFGCIIYLYLAFRNMSITSNLFNRKREEI